VVERAFEHFFTAKGVGKGTGLGLSMVYGVARQSGGEVRIQSAPAEGTCVIIELKRATAAADTPSTETGPVREAPRGAGETVMVVDDDADVRGAIRS
jgi:hypothetical protein